jgi:hypothetical protein
MLEKIASTNVMVPRWSPDGARLLVDYVNHDRQIGVISVDGTGFIGVLGGANASPQLLGGSVGSRWAVVLCERLAIAS